MLTALPIKLRKYDAKVDNDVVVHTWLSSYSRCRLWSHLSYGLETRINTPYRQNRSLWWKRYKPTVEKLLELYPTTVCCLEEDPAVVCGWLCGTHEMVHYVLAKRAFSDFRPEIMELLLGDLPQKPVVFTHELLDMPGWPKHPSTWTYDPLIAIQTSFTSPEGEASSAAGGKQGHRS